MRNASPGLAHKVPMGRSTAEGKRYRLGAWEKLEESLPRERDTRAGWEVSSSRGMQAATSRVSKGKTPTAAGGEGCASQGGPWPSLPTSTSQKVCEA